MFYVLDENNNKVEAYDKQGVIALLEQAIADGDLSSIAADSAFIDKLKCCVGTGTHHIAFVPQATYNELQANGQLIADAYYFITDDTTTDDINAQLEELTAAVNIINDNSIRYLYSAAVQEVMNTSNEKVTINLGVRLPDSKTLADIQDIAYTMYTTSYDDSKKLTLTGISTHTLSEDQTYIDITTNGTMYESSTTANMYTVICRLSLDSNRNILLLINEFKYIILQNIPNISIVNSAIIQQLRFGQINIHLV